MSSRERWTVYPLLFLALGLALRATSGSVDDDGTTRFIALDAGRVVCRELRIDSEDGETLVHVGRVKDGGGRIEIRDTRGRDVVAIGTHPRRADGGVELFGIDGREEARLSPTGFGPPPADEIDEADEIDNAAVPQDPSPR